MLSETLLPSDADVSSALAVLEALHRCEPEQPLLGMDGNTVTRRDFAARVAVCSGALVRQGIGHGDHVGIVLPNSIAWCVFFWATVNVGAVPVPLDPQTGSWEIRNLASLLPIKLWAIVPRFRTAEIASSIAEAYPNTRPFVVSVEGHGEGLTPMSEFMDGAPSLPIPLYDPKDDDALNVACTSGTTGNPKLIVLPHRGFVKAQRDMAGVLGLSSKDRVLLGMPLYHQGGFGMGLQSLLSGATTHYRSTFEPNSFLETIERERITVVQLSATLAKILLSTPTLSERDISSLRLAYFAGEVLPDEVAREFWERRGIRVVNIIGSSETGTMVAWDSATDTAHPPSDFLPLPFTRALVAGAEPEDGERGIEAPVGERGNLWISTDGVLTEYLGNAPETAKRLAVRDGLRWFDTQDLTVRLPNGRIRFVGRAKRVIKRGANLVYPEEIESFLLTHPDVAAVAVQSEKHPLFGEAIVAHLQPAPGATLERAKVLAFCRGSLAAYKIPDRILVVDLLPSEIGKIEYKRLRTQVVD